MNLFSTPRALRTLAPAGGFSSPWALFRTAKLYRLDAANLERTASQLRLTLKIFASASEVRLAGSGKAALLSVLSGIRSKTSKKYFLVSAYTCPDVAVAILRAGFAPTLVDVSPESCSLQSDSVDPHVLADSAGIVLSNLYGIPDRLEPWKKIQVADPNFFVIDDGCQAFQSLVEGERVGSRKGTLGVTSFGRGKSLCGIGGGAILLPIANSGAETSLKFSEVVAEIFGAETERPQKFCLFDTVKQCLLGAALWAFERPWLYTVPSSIPSLRLGETKCELDFDTNPATSSQILAALAQIGRVERDIEQRQVRTAAFEAALGRETAIGLPSLIARREGLAAIQLLRFPLVFSTREARDGALAKLQGAGLGANASYPRTLESYPELAGKLSFGEINGARALAERILTLPIHRYVTMQDVDRMAALIRQNLSV